MGSFSRSRRRGIFTGGFGKRALDICISLIALIVLAPLFLFVAILVKLISPGPVLFWEKRVGRDAQIFRIVKFRSMVIDADREEDVGITTPGNERVTPVGKILRKMRINDLPQLWNVLKGEMSLVGPRPELPTYVAQYTFEQLRVLSALPGITDIASIHRRDQDEDAGAQFRSG